MTVPSTPFRKEHTLTGSIVPLVYDWTVENKNHLLVTLVNTSLTPNVETTLVVDTNYTVNNVGVDGGGTITPASAHTAGWKIVITSNVPYEQDTDFTNQNSVMPEEAESMADKLGRQIKQIVEVLSRTVKTTVGGGVQPDDLLDAINDAVTQTSTNAGLTAADVVTTGNNVTSAQAAQAAAESAAAGIKWRPSVRASTTAALPSVTYNNGASGVGATLTATANGALAAQDGVTLTAGQRLLVKDQAAQLQNGVYTVTQVGTGGTPFILTRATDADTWLELVSQAVIIEEGSTLLDTAYICTVNQGGTIGTTAVTFGTFSPPIVIASQAEAEAGVENTKVMSALRVQQWGNSNAVIKTVFKDRILNGLKTSNNAGDATNDIDVDAGAAVSDDGTEIMVLGSSITKRLDAAWAVGTNNGGLDTGSIANDSYYIWLIKRTDTGVVDVLFSASPTSPTMPTNYNKKKRIGAFVRAGGTILQYTQRGREFRLVTPVLDYANSTPGTSRVTVTLASVPTDIVVNAILRPIVIDNGNYTYVSALTEADLAPSTGSAPLCNLGAGAINSPNELYVYTNASGQVSFRCTTNGTIRIAAVGWVDLLGEPV